MNYPKGGRENISLTQQRGGGRVSHLQRHSHRYFPFLKENLKKRERDASRFGQPKKKSEGKPAKMKGRYRGPGGGRVFGNGRMTVDHARKTTVITAP